MKSFVLLLTCLQLFCAATWGQQATTNKESEAQTVTDCSQLAAIQKQLDWDVQRLKDGTLALP